MWGAASHVTFRLVQLLLGLFVADPVIKPDEWRIGTHRFTAIISEQCSGLEGIALLLVFGCVWLILFRDEVRFPHALILFPLGVTTLFLLNAFRITALILIGNTGARDIAAGGFHSQAGWIAFNSVAFGSSIAARRWRWISARAPSLPAEETATPTTVFLAPFLAILAAGMISRASSGAFEWLYPIRVFAALAVLWHFRRSYSQLDWRISWAAPAVGFAVFMLWVAVDRMWSGTLTMPMALAGATAPLRYSWIGMRIVGAVLAVPVAEELAFRGFALRRFVNADFESVGFKSTGWVAVLGSSILFGLMHGNRWLLATVAGSLYALLIRRTGRMGDAVATHALTNGLIAGYVLMFDQWQLW
jgi:exosortase E/protease (VPEID-CTERM system)